MGGEYSARELSELLGITVRAVQKRAAAEKWACREQPNPNGGGIQKLYLAESFGTKIKDAIGRAVLARALGEGSACAYPNPMQGGGGLPAAAARQLVGGGNGNGAGLVRRSGPSADGRVIVPRRADEVGLARYRLVRKWREVAEASGHGSRREAMQAFLLAYQTGRLLPGVYDLVGDISQQTLYRLDKQLRDAGDDYYAIADGRGGWRKYGTTKWRERELSIRAQEELLRCWLRPEKPTVKLAIHAARMILQRKGVEEEAHDATWRRWLQDYEKRHQDVIVLAREGEKAYRDKVGPYVTRDDSILKVGQVLVADGHDLNFMVLHPVTGKAVRMKLIVFFDWASRYPVGWQIMPTENVVAIMAALRMAILTLGKYPLCVYLDNGKAFKAKVFTETNPDLEELSGVYARLGIATQFAQPYNARAKLVERFFETMQMQCESIIPTFCGGSIADKPAWMMRNEKFHRAWQQARTNGWVPSVREAAHMLAIYFGWYGMQPHDGLGNCRPIDALEAGRGPGVDAAELNYQFLWAKKCTPRNCRVTLYNIDYEADCLHGLGEPVLVKHDMADLGLVYCYTLDGLYLGEARPVQALHPLARLFGDQVAVDQVKAEMSKQRRLLKQTKTNLLELGASTQQVEGLKALPWNRKVRLDEAAAGRDGGAEVIKLKPVIGRGQVDEVLVVDEAEVKGLDPQFCQAQPVATDRPIFGNETERYFWLCEQMIGQVELGGEDMEWIREFEADGSNRISVELMRSRMAAAGKRGPVSSEQ